MLFLINIFLMEIKKWKKKKVILVKVVLNNLKDKLKMSLDNDLYQEWCKTNKKINFRNYVINQAIDYLMKKL